MSSHRSQVITLGAITLDTFLIGEALAAKRDVRTNDEVEQFPLGAKVELDDVVFTVGGGAANAAVTFARQGLSTKVIGKVGDDFSAHQALKSLRAEGVDVSSVSVALDEDTGFSAILLAPSGERTILSHRGTSEMMKPADLKTKLHADWLYITSLGGNWPMLEAAIKQANSSGTKVAIDPGSKELADPIKLKKALAGISMLKGNKEELAKLFNSQDVKTILKKAAALCQYVVVTDAHKGAYATDGHHYYEIGIYKDVKVIDRTGAGDAFGSGLVSQLALGRDLSYSLVFASANSTAVVQQVGAQPGILHGSSKLDTSSVKISKL